MNMNIEINKPEIKKSDEKEEKTQKKDKRIILLILVIYAFVLSKEINTETVSKMSNFLSKRINVIILLLIVVFAIYIRLLKFRKDITSEQYDNIKQTERHANVALIIAFCEMLGMHFTGYWTVWLVTYFNIE
jgi:hypothetical protein